VKKIFFLLILLAIVVAVGFRLYEELDSRASSPVGADPSLVRPVMLVEMAEVQTRTFRSNLEILGELLPLASVQVMSRVSGRLKELYVERGDRVKKGQLLAVVDDEDILQQIRRAEASISVTEAGVNREEASCDNLEILARRYQRLHSDSLISTQELEDVEGRFRVAKAQLEFAKAQVEQARASLRELRIQQEQTRIYSPLSGFAGTRYLDPGALVSPSVPIVSVIDVIRVKTVVPIAEGLLSTVNVGQVGQVTVDAYPEREYRGRVTRISPFLNPETRSADVEIEIANEKGELRPGMFARVVIESGQPQSSLAIPRSALLTRGTEKAVFLVSEDSVTHYRAIQIGRIQGDYVEVLGGLEAGTQVVTFGAQKLNEGDKVKVQ